MLSLLFSLIVMAKAETVIAVIDTGMDINHSFLKEHLWTNVGETGIDAKGKNKATNGIDDDKNGFIDDVHGFNFSANNNNLTDEHGHGTHIAGIIAQSLKNYPKGDMQKIKIMPLKFFNPKNSGITNLQSSIKAFYYAIQMGAHIINYSGGGPEKSQEEFQAVLKAEQKNVLVVAASGNEKSNSDLFPFYPASYGLSNIVSVTAMDQLRKVLPSSNFGIKNVHIAAPGKDIVSSLPGNKYGKMTGTSQATAFVSAALAIVREMRKDLQNNQQAVAHLLKTSAYEDNLSFKTQASSYLQIERSLQMHAQENSTFDLKKALPMARVANTDQ